MVWQIKTIARKSSLSATPFHPGDRIVCLVYKDPNAEELGRVDLLQQELEGYKLPGPLLGRWTRVVKEPDEEGASVRETMASAEDFFFSLFENETQQDESVSNILKHLLALMLERKRILRAIAPRQNQGFQLYLHVKTKRELQVPIADISTELMLSIQDTIGDIIL